MQQWESVRSSAKIWKSGSLTNKSEKSFGTISKELHVPRSTVQTIVYERKKHGTVVSLPCTGRKCKSSFAAERKLLRMVNSKPKNTNRQDCGELQSVGHYKQSSLFNIRMGCEDAMQEERPCSRFGTLMLE